MLIYLHGLNSSGQSLKARLLREALPEESVLAPDYPAQHADKAVEVLSAIFEQAVQAGQRPAVVGSSMGGFYGQYLARRFAVSHLFLINPALKPWALLTDYVDQTMVKADGTEYRLTRELIEATRTFGIDGPCREPVPTTVFLDRGDEVIDFEIARELYRDCGRVMIYADGDHSFQHMDQAIDAIRHTLQGDSAAGRA